MKKFLTVMMFLSLILVSSDAWAFRSGHFKGWYEILSQREVTAENPYFLFDVDRLEAIWNRYAEGPLPEDFVKIKDEPTILAGFTNRDLLFFTLEASAIVSNDFLAIGGENKQLELRRRPDGKFDLGIKEGQRVTIYEMAAPVEFPSNID